MKRPKDEDYRSNPSGTLAYLFALEKYCDYVEQHHQANLKGNRAKRLKMRHDAINIFELTKGFTTETTDNAMKSALEMAHNVMVLTSDLDGF